MAGLVTQTQQCQRIRIRMIKKEKEIRKYIYLPQKHKTRSFF